HSPPKPTLFPYTTLFRSEEGSRLIYIVPRSVVDSILPLEIQPNPAQIVRVFVGRMEIITPAVEEDVKQAIANNDQPGLEKYGRLDRKSTRLNSSHVSISY